MSVNGHRKCAKCGKTSAEDKTVSYHRFPMPGKTNTLKARAWATYCWPDQDWTLEQSMLTLYTSHKVLCGRHFSSSQFYDIHRQKLSRFAVPDSKEVAKLLQNKENIYLQNEEQSNTYVAMANQGETLPKLTPFKSIQVQPSTSASAKQSFVPPCVLEPTFRKQNEQQSNTNVTIANKDEMQHKFSPLQIEPSTSASAGQSSLPPSVLEPEFRKHTAEAEPKKASHIKKEEAS